jgi:hypothetical protein
MGEYAKRLSDGEHIKIGTCEDMYYLRRDQIDLVQYDGGFTPDVLTVVRFRFPFPGEDKIAPGDFNDYNYGFKVYDFLPPDGLEHYSVQYEAGGQYGGLLASLPCPLSAEAKALEKAEGFKIRYHFNGFGAHQMISQQRLWAGHWATVMECRPCGAKYRLPELADAEPLLTALERMAVQETGRDREDYAKTIRTIAARVRRGYEEGL